MWMKGFQLDIQKESFFQSSEGLLWLIIPQGLSNLVHLIVRSCTVPDSDSNLLPKLHAEALVSFEMSGIEGVNSSIFDPERLLKVLKSAARLEHLGVLVNQKDELPSTSACRLLSRQLKESRKLKSLSLGCREDSVLSVPSCYIRAFQPVATQIVSLNIRNFKSADNKDQKGLIKDCLNLRTLQACSNGMDDDALQIIGRHCTKLVKVKLLDSLNRSGISEEGLKHLATGYPQLKSLSVCAKGVTCKSLIFFSQRKGNIECFKLYLEDLCFYNRGRNNTGLLDEGFASLVQLCQKLEKLRAANVSNEFFCTIARKNLAVLIVSVAAAAEGKTPDLRGLAKSCPRLEKLGIQGCLFPSLPMYVFRKTLFKRMRLEWNGGCTNLGECRKFLTYRTDVNLHVVNSMGQHDLAKVFLVYIYKTCVPGKSFFQ